MKIFDLSVPTEASPSEPLPLNVVHESHAQSAAQMASFFEATPADLPEGQGWANDHVTMNAHAGTHVDAPWHYYPTCGGARARTIDEMPLEWFYGDGVVLDMRHKPCGGLIEVADLQAELARIGYSLKPGDIVMINTGADKSWGQAAYFHAGAGMTAASTRWLIAQGIRVMGIDAWGWDQPFWAMRDRFKESGDPGVIWEAHRVGRDLEYCHIEKLANLDTLPRPFGFKVSCFPVKLTGGSAGWARVVALFEDL
ncbi:cyclase family protein [Chloroflexales bacterium ZM16-3]|nr:cyclase family protein [Chloroflexales bacterium ZM16-3]